jgi:hypothetical protein
MRGPFSLLPFLFVATAGLLLQACSAPGDDPRVSLCRNLAADLTGGEAGQWQGEDNRFVRPSYVVVSVSGGAGDAAACFYEYDAAEDTSSAANPFSAYATLPYQMEINGVPVAAATLDTAVKVQQKQLPRKVLEEARKSVEMLDQGMRKTLEAVNER